MGCNSPSTQESWQCQTWGPMEPPRSSCQCQQMTAGPRRDGRRPPPPRCSLVPVLTSVPLAPFPAMVVVGEELWSPGPHSWALFLAPFTVQASRAVERAENEVRMWPGEGRAGREGLSRIGSSGPKPPATLPSRPAPFWFTLSPVPTSLFSLPFP